MEPTQHTTIQKGNIAVDTNSTSPMMSARDAETALSQLNSLNKDELRSLVVTLNDHKTNLLEALEMLLEREYKRTGTRDLSDAILLAGWDGGLHPIVAARAAIAKARGEETK